MENLEKNVAHTRADKRILCVMEIARRLNYFARNLVAMILPLFSQWIDVPAPAESRPAAIGALTTRTARQTQCCAAQT